MNIRRITANCSYTGISALLPYTIHLVVKLYFRENNFQLYLGDLLKLLPEFEVEHFDMVFADPPYHLSDGGFSVYSGKKVLVDKGEWDKSRGIEQDLEFHLEWLKACRRVLRKNGTIWVSGTYHSIYPCGYAMQKLGFHILNDICWFKPKAPHNFSKRFFSASHETLIWARKYKEVRHNFNFEYMQKFVDEKDFLKIPGEPMRSVWAIDAPSFIEQRFGKHPTQKPASLLKRIILSCTKKGDKILDPFTGSSTTGLEAYLYGREFVGIDTNKEYLDLSIKRFRYLQDNLRKFKLLSK